MKTVLALIIGLLLSQSAIASQGWNVYGPGKSRQYCYESGRDIYCEEADGGLARSKADIEAAGYCVGPC